MDDCTAGAVALECESLNGLLRTEYHGVRNHSTGFNVKSQHDARIALRDKLGPKAERGSRLLRAWSYLMMGALFIPLHAIPSERQLDSITVEAKREELRLQVDQFVQSATDAGLTFSFEAGRSFGVPRQTAKRPRFSQRTRRFESLTAWPGKGDIYR